MNNYYTGKLGVADGIALVFGIVMPRVFLSTVSNLIQENGQILWLAMTIYTIIPIVPLLMMVYVQKEADGDVFLACQRLVGKTGACLILLIYSMMFLGDGALILRLYAEYTLLTALPRVEFQMVIIWYAAAAGIICYLGMEALTRTAYIMLPTLVGGIILIFIMLIPFYMGYNLTPWRGNGLWEAVHTGIKGAGYNIGVLALLFLAPAFQNVRTIKKAAVYALGGAVILRVAFILAYMMIFDVAVGSEKTLPLFELARLVYINQYIQHLEALFIVVWVIFGLLAIAGSLYIGLYLIALLLKLPTLQTIVPLGVMIAANLAMLPPDIGYALVVDQQLLTVFDVGIYLIPSLLFVMALWKNRRKRSCTSV